MCCGRSTARSIWTRSSARWVARERAGASLPGVATEHVLVDGDAEAGAVGDLDVTVDHGELLLHEVVQQRVGAQRVLEDEAGALAGGERDAGGEGRRAGPQMRRQAQVERGRDGGDADALAEAAR